MRKRPREVEDEEEEGKAEWGEVRGHGARSASQGSLRIVVRRVASAVVLPIVAALLPLLGTRLLLLLLLRAVRFLGVLLGVLLRLLVLAPVVVGLVALLGGRPHRGGHRGLCG